MLNYERDSSTVYLLPIVHVLHQINATECGYTYTCKLHIMCKWVNRCK